MPKPLACSPGTRERRCRGRDPPRFHKLLSASRQESHSRGQPGSGAAEDRRRVWKKSKGRTCQLCVTPAFQPGCHRGAHIISAQFCKEETLAPAPITRNLRLGEGKGLLQGHSAGDSLQSQDSSPGPSGSKTCDLPRDPTEERSHTFRPPSSLLLTGHPGRQTKEA